MLEKIERKQVSKQDLHTPQDIAELIEAYALDELWPYLDRIVDYINSKEA